MKTLSPAAPKRAIVPRRVLTWTAGVLSFSVLAVLLISIAYHMVVPPPPLRVLLVRDVPLPSGIGLVGKPPADPLAPGVTQTFDHFDFQALDPNTHLLFIAHTGATPNKLKLARIPFDPKADGHVVVFDTQRNAVVGRVNVPHIAGIAVAPDLHRVFAADADDSIIWAIDETSLVATPIPLDANESPDAVSYDPVDQRIFVSDPGVPADPNETANINPDNQNVIMIDAVAEKVLKKINIGHLSVLPGEKVPLAPDSNAPQFGYDIGHNAYDSARHRLFVTTQILQDLDGNALLPPLGTGELMMIDPVRGKIVGRVVLPRSCSSPHGMAVDTQQEVAFIACIDEDTSQGIVQNLTRVDLRAMRVIPANPASMRLAATPDIVTIDHADQVLFVACKAGLSVFDERAGAFRKLRDYTVGKNPHTIAVNEETHEIYLPTNAGGRPVLRIMKYNANGA